MASLLGMRQGKVFENVPANTEIVIDGNRGAFLAIEVTNDTASTVYVHVNDYLSENGHPGVKIPVKAGTTRTIPMTVYKFKATGVVTVVAYGM